MFSYLVCFIHFFVVVDFKIFFFWHSDEGEKTYTVMQMAQK